MNYLSELIYSRRPAIRIFRHVLFWATDIISYLSVISVNRTINSTEVYAILLKITPIIFTTYFILYYLIPNFSKLNSKGTFLLWILALFMVIGVGMRLYNYFVVNPMLNIPNPVLNFWDLRPVVSQIFSYMAVICMAITIKLITNKVQLEQFNEELQEEKKKAELNFLKTQMQPHFLFNTLNTLYSETIQDSGKGQLVVLHLSSMLRFILEECNKPFIRFEDEIKVIKDFIALEQLRHGDRLKVNIKVKGVTGYAMISPLVFLPFIENSFKHSLTIVRGSIQIDIEMGIESGYCFLMVENECISSNETKRADTMEHGKGIINIKRQLDLIYGKDYSLSFNGVKDKFHVSLKVPARSDFKYVEN